MVLLYLCAWPFAQAQQTGSDFDHSSTGYVLNGQHQNVRCETCHLKGVFKGTPKTCEACHGWNNPRASTVMPTDHIPTRNAPCESCHAATMSQFQDALRVFTHVGVAPQTCLNCHDSRHPHPGVKTNPSDAMHMAVLDNNTPCGKCHTSVQFTGPKYPANHIPTAAVPCVACHTTSDFSVMPSITIIHANAQSTSTNCQQCHSAASAAAFAMPTMNPPLVGPPGNHIGMNGQSCEACHVGVASSLTLPVVDSAKFSNSKFSHAGVSTGCASCHGPGITNSSFAGVSNIIVMPDSSSPSLSSHIPSSTNCETCHAASMPSGLISPNSSSTVPGSAFQLPKPSVTMVHAGVTSNCVACHDTNAQWLGMQLYPMVGYTGFQTRPQFAAGTFNVADAQHPQTGDCSDCHIGISFNPTAIAKPPNHIPVATGAACGACHNTANFAQMPTVAAIHANAPAASMVSGAANCAQCHSSSNAAAYAMPTLIPAIVSPPGGHIAMGALDCGSCHVGSNSSLTLPVQNTANFGNSAFSHSGISSGCASCHGDGVVSGTFYGVTPKTKAALNPPHVPTTLACESCHVGSVPATLVPMTGATSGTTFAGGQFSHSGISSGCATCHAASVGSGTFYGITGIVTMPPTSPSGASSHIPTSSTCEDCHAGSTPSALLSVTLSHSVPGTGFQNAPPTGAMIHNGTSASCSSCHEAGMSWVGMSAYPRVPAAYNASNPNQLYNGFNTRPTSAGAGYSLADSAHPATGDCAQCHGNTAAFGGPAMPGNHIPYAAAATCSACHGDFSALPTISAIHANIQNTSAGCDQCHSPANAALYGANMLNGVGIVSLPVKHLSTGTLGCEGCHVGANSSMAATPVPDGAKFTGSLFNHSGTTVACATCHGAAVTASSFAGIFPTTIGSLSPAHVPTTAACDSCHVAGAPSGLVPSASMTTFANAQFSHAGISTGCVACHGPGLSNSRFFGVSPLIVMPPTSPSGSGAHLPTSTTCEDCHGGAKPSGLVAAGSSNAVGSSLFRNSPPASATIHNGVVSGCSNCHEAGMTWVGMDLGLYARNFTTLQASSTTQYKGFQTRPVTGGGGNSIANGGHPDTTTGDCSLCHGSTSYFGQPTEPANHIPYLNGTACSACHTSFGSVPTIAATHAKLQNVNGNCEQCHSAANAALYAATTTQSPIKTPASNHIPMGNLGCAQCHVGNGSHIASTPVANGADFGLSAFSHAGISTGCSTCHGVNVVAGTFDGVTPKTVASLTPAHIPVSNNIGCETCHANSIPPSPVPPTGYSGSPSFSGGQFIHTYITSGCATCHGPSVTGGTFYGVSNIVVMPATSGANAHIPSSTTCEDCHAGSLPSTLLSVTTPRAVPGSGFATAPPDTTKIHNGITAGCTNCHEAGMAWVGMTAYPRIPASVNASNPAQLYNGFNTRPLAAASGFSMADSGHPASGDCVQCHGGFTAFGAPAKPANHIPYAASASCTSCHATWGTHPTIAAIHANLQSAGSNCAQCHSAANAATYSTASRTIVGPAGNHVPLRGLGCESCHVGSGSSVPTTPVTGSPTFAGSAFSHSGMTTNCAECHGQGITGTSFQGISTIVVMPPSASAGSTSHLPTSTTCENCHRGSMPTGLVPGNAAHAAPNSGFLSPAPTSTMVHAGVTGSCASCHEKDMLWMSMGPYPITTSAPYRGFQTRPYGSATTYSVADSVHPASGDCSNCHSGFVEWATTVKPANHIPTANVACSTCHTTTNYSTMPTMLAIHTNAPSSTSNCAQCHSAANAALYSTTGMTIKAPANNHIPMANLGCEGCHVGSISSVTTPVGGTPSFAGSAFNHSGVTSSCATCHDNITGSTFQGGIIPVTLTSPVLSPAHVPNPGGLDCGVCHQAIPAGLSKVGNTSATFAGGKFSHSGISNGCDACHGSGISGSSFKGITAIVVLPATTSGSTGHIPSPINANCEVCHLGSTPSTLVNASASVTTPGLTKFKTPTPTGTMIHTSISSGCSSCHENGKTWVNINLYPPNSSTYVSGGTYTGFQTRPVSGGVSPAVNDANHPSTGDCSNCHGSTATFSSVAKPANHIPTSASAQCQNCHTNLSLVGGAYVTSSIDFSNPLPTVTNIHTYAPSTTGNCVQCHSSANAAAYAIASVGFTIKSPASVANHIPFGSTGCEVCHVPTSTPVQTGATFAGGKFSHAGFTTGCAACHGAGIGNSSFTGVTAIVAIAASSNTPGSSTHIPYTANCETCHSATVPSGLVSVTSTANRFASPLASGTLIHANSTSFACKACHERAYVWLGMANYPRTPASLNLAVPTTAYNGFQTRPGSGATTYGYTDAGHTGNTSLDTGDCSLCHAGTTSFTGEGKPAGHMPTTVTTCSTCHTTGGDYSISGGLATSTVLHTGITIPSAVVKYTAATLGNASCKTCHVVGTGGTSGTAPFAGCTTQSACTSPPPINYQPKTVAGVASHVPTGVLSCDACHVGTTAFSGVNMKSGSAAGTMHANAALASIQCQSCHEFGLAWTNVNNLLTRVPNKHTTASRKAPNDCSNCHSFNGGFRALQRPMMREALVNPDMGRIRPNLQVGKPSRGTLGNSFDHQGVKPGQCKTCHDGKSASGMPARHLMVPNSCDTCHRTTTWTPAQFNHSGVSANTCMACHNGMSASGKPAGHFMTARSCDSCHKNMAWKPVTYQHMSPQYQPSGDPMNCVGCHITNGEIIPRQMRGLIRTKPIPAGP